uniref:Uncharacterized protein n=1 Tax=Melopsittacus undulatus TaxID=13146 RepID=A0A8V5FUH2_MELUD
AGHRSAGRANAFWQRRSLLFTRPPTNEGCRGQPRLPTCFLRQARGRALELRLLLGLLADAAAGSAPSLFWVGLKRGASACTDAGQPLRGFSWEGTGGEAAPQEVPAALGRWVKEPVRSCLAVRCAGLHLAAAAPDGGPSWGWKERFCQRESQGYVCKYLYEGACPDLSPTDALGLDYSLPFGESSVGPGFSPPGTVLTVVCSGGEVRLICRPQRGGFAWQGADGPLCPCPIHHRRPATGQCSQTAGCRDAAGGFSCACTTGGLEGTLCAATGGAPTTAGGPAEPPGAGADERRPHAATPGGSAGPPAAPTAASDGEKTDAALPSSSSNYVFILVTVAVVVLIVLIMTLLGVFKLCFNKKSEARPRRAPGSQAKQRSASSLGAAGALSLGAAPRDNTHPGRRSAPPALLLQRCWPGSGGTGALGLG